MAPQRSQKDQLRAATNVPADGPSRFRVGHHAGGQRGVRENDQEDEREGSAATVRRYVGNFFDGNISWSHE